MALTDQNRADIEALIADVDAFDPALIDGAYEVPAPDPTAEPTQDDVDGAAATVVALETRQNELRAAVEKWRGAATTLAYFAGIDQATDWMLEIAGTSSTDRATIERIAADRDLLARMRVLFPRVDATIADLVEAEQLTTQMLDHWRSALAVLEHDLKWQAYVAEAFGATENPRRAAALDQKAAA